MFAYILYAFLTRTCMQMENGKLHSKRLISNIFHFHIYFTFRILSRLLSLKADAISFTKLNSNNINSKQQIANSINITLTPHHTIRNVKLLKIQFHTLFPIFSVRSSIVRENLTENSHQISQRDQLQQEQRK